MKWRSPKPIEPAGFASPSIWFRWPPLCRAAHVPAGSGGNTLVRNWRSRARMCTCASSRSLWGQSSGKRESERLCVLCSRARKRTSGSKLARATHMQMTPSSFSHVAAVVPHVGVSPQHLTLICNSLFSTLINTTNTTMKFESALFYYETPSTTTIH